MKNGGINFNRLLRLLIISNQNLSFLSNIIKIIMNNYIDIKINSVLIRKTKYYAFKLFFEIGNSAKDH